MVLSIELSRPNAHNFGAYFFEVSGKLGPFSFACAWFWFIILVSGPFNLFSLFIFYN